VENVMVDLETLGTRPGSVILSIGACFFDPLFNEPGPTFYQVIDVASSCVAGLRGDNETIKWWLKQGDDAQEAYHQAFFGEGEPLVKTLEAFAAWLTSMSSMHDGTKRVKVWGNGAAFDNALLAAAYHAAGLTPPWKFWNDRCFRTLKSLGADLGVKEPPFTGTKHHALDDAVHQANWACLVLRAMAPSPVPEGDRGLSLDWWPAVNPEPPVTDPDPAAPQPLMPDPPAGYLMSGGRRAYTKEEIMASKQRIFPTCATHQVAMIPTSSGFVCPACGGDGA